MYQNQRLKKSKDFKNAIRNGGSWANQTLVLICYFSGLSSSRVGFSVSKRVGNAVTRNKIKRRLREIIRNEDLPAGDISLFSAWLLFSLTAIGFLVAAGFINNACMVLAPVALFFICFYSLTKRFTDYTHVWLGVALALSPIGAWIAVKGGSAAELLHLWPLSQSLLPPIVLGVAVVFWLIGFDIIYAIQDFEFDRQNGLRSLVTAWGPKNALTASFLSHMIMLALILLYGILLKMRVAFLIGWLIILFCLLFEHWLARKRSLDWVNNAFFKLNALISSVFFFVVATEIIFPFFRRIQ